MANWQDPQTTGANTATVGVPRAARDAGLRSYMLSVYNYMASGVLLTGIIALLFAPYAGQVLVRPDGQGMSLLGWIVTLSPLGFVFAMSFGVNRMKTGTLQMLFWGFAAVMGLSMSTLFLVFTGVSIAQTFFVTAIAFAGLSLWGYTTKKDISGWGSFLIMGVIGLIVAMVVNIWLASPAVTFAVSAIGVLIFAGLTAYDTQNIKNTYLQMRSAQGEAYLGKAAIMGALSLYLNFLNMFMMLLQLFGNRN
jgi:FtsH-binding integral membrane protein